MIGRSKISLYWIEFRFICGRGGTKLEALTMMHPNFGHVTKDAMLMLDGAQDVH